MRRRQVTLLPEALQYQRKLRGFSQQVLAARARAELRKSGSDHTVSPTMVALLEGGTRQPSPETLGALAAALGVPEGALAFVHVDGAECSVCHRPFRVAS